MDTKYVFAEKQQFRQWWVWVLIVATLSPALIAIYNEPTFDYVESFAIILPIIVLGLVAVLFFMLRLETKIDEEGIFIKFFPLTKQKHYQWKDIREANVTKYNPLLEYGGYGLRLGAWNVSGNQGLRLTFNNGKKFLIGTQKPDEMQKTIDKYKN